MYYLNMINMINLRGDIMKQINDLQFTKHHIKLLRDDMISLFIFYENLK